MEKAQDARTKNDEGAMKDAATLKATNLIQEYMDKKYVSNQSLGTGIVTAGDYVANQIVGKDGGYTFAVSGNTLTISDAKGNEVYGTILDSGNISWGTTTTNNNNNDEEEDLNAIAVETLQGMIGRTVNYTGYSSNYDAGWRLFYVDNANAYLISTQSIEYSSEMPLSNKNPLTVMASGTYGGTWNSMWLNHSGCITNQNRHKAVTYLCDSDNWTSYVATNAPAGTKAYGSPTLQLFIASYNLTHEAEHREEINSSNVTAYGYPPTIGWVMSFAGDNEEDLYEPGYEGDDYWLASPYYETNPYEEYDENDNPYTVDEYESSILYEQYHNSEIGYSDFSYENYYKIRPIVVIPRANIQENTDGITLDVIIQNT